MGLILDGHTPKGSYKITLVLTGDMVEQLTRLIDMAKFIDGNMEVDKRPETMDVVAYRAFLEEILLLLKESLVE